MAKNSPNAPGGSNRQGPSPTKGGKRGPIVGKMSDTLSGTQRPWSLKDGKSSGAGRNMSGHNWKKRPPNG
jgi:hypothetical protein